MLPPLMDSIPSRHKIALEISLCLFKRLKFNWLERLPVPQEAAGSSPVAPAKFCCIIGYSGLLVLTQRGRGTGHYPIQWSGDSS